MWTIREPHTSTHSDQSYLMNGSGHNSLGMELTEWRTQYPTHMLVPIHRTITWNTVWLVHRTTDVMYIYRTIAWNTDWFREPET